jgi:multiple sugar transport system substrate-binding protein
MRPKTGTTVAALAAATALVLTACSGGSGTQSTGTAAATAPAEKVELSFWSWAPDMDKVAEVWNKANPNIHVTVQKQDGGDPAVTKLLTAIKAGSGAPDLMQAEYQKIPTLVAANALADVAGKLPSGLKAHFPEGVWNSVTLGTGKVYAIPQDSGPMQFYYRADIFDKLGLKVPTTWAEYADVAAKVRAADPTI